MQDHRKLKQYRELLHNKLNNLPETDSINEEWDSMKNIITEAANEIIQTQSKQPRNEWLDEECRLYIKKKN